MLPLESKFCAKFFVMVSNGKIFSGALPGNLNLKTPVLITK